MIFDGFPSLVQAARFAVHVEADYGLEVAVHKTVAASDAADPFPFALTPPIVHVERTDEEDEAEVERAVAAFGGRFAGT